MYGSEQAKDDAGAALEAIVERHASRVKLSRVQVREVVASALNETRELFSTLNIPTDRMRLKQLSESAKAALGSAALEAGEWPSITPDARERDAIELRDRLLQELEGAAESTSGSTLGEVLLLALEGALRGGPFDRVIMCVLDADRGRLVARSALGEGSESLMKHFDFPMTMRGGPIVSATQQRQSVYLPADRAMNAIEARWAGQLGVAQFGVFPIVVAGKIVGCLYCDRAADASLAAITPDRATLRYVKSLSDVVVSAIAARRRASAASAAPVTTTPESSASVPNASTTGEHRGTARSGADKVALVLRLLQGTPVAQLSSESGVSVAQLESWRADVLAAAAARLQ